VKKLEEAEAKKKESAATDVADALTGITVELDF